MFSLPFAARRLVVRHVRHPLSAFRRASTKPNSSKSQIKNAFTNPAPPVLARYPILYKPAKILKYGLGICLGAHIFAEYFFTLSLAEGISMLPTMNSMGDWLLLSKRYRRGRDIVVGDIVSFKHPIDEGVHSVKRVIGMPGDFVLRDSPETSGQMIQIPDGHCFVVGDNLKFSRDSRMFGPLPLGLVKGKVIGRLSTEPKLAWSTFEESGLQPADTYGDVD